MDRFSTNRKRSAAAYNDFSAAKRLQQPNFQSNHNSLFLSDDEDDILTDDDFADLNHVLRSQSVQHMQSRAARSNPNQQRSAISSTAQPRMAMCFTSTSSTSGTTNLVSGASTGDNSSTATNAPNLLAAVDLIEIKDEKDIPVEPLWVKGVPEQDRVKLFIGKLNKQVLVKRVDLAKSTILTSWITDDPDQGAYVMRPQLVSQSFTNFDAVLQYLHSSEYAPMLIENPNDKDGPAILDGLNTDKAYAKELVRSGRIYVIAQTFSVEGLADLVFQKIKKVDCSKFSIKSIVELAGVVFSDKTFAPLPKPALDRANLDGGSQNNSVRPKDKLEEWITTQVAMNFQEIMNSQQTTFWKVVQETSKKLFLAQVLEETAQHYRATGGRLPGPIVELD